MTTVYVVHHVYEDVEYMYSNDQEWSGHTPMGVNTIVEEIETDDTPWQFAVNLERLGYSVSGSGYTLNCVLYK